LENSLRQLGRVDSFLPQHLLTSQLHVNSRTLLPGVLRGRTHQQALKMAPCHSSLSMGNAELSCFAGGLPCRGKGLSCYSCTGIGFVGSINIVPELVLLVCHGHCLAYLQVVLPSSEGEPGWWGAADCFCVVFFGLAYFSDIHCSFIFLPCFPHFGSSVCSLCYPNSYSCSLMLKGSIPLLP
jgi:hypothetical protein